MPTSVPSALQGDGNAVARPGDQGRLDGDQLTAEGRRDVGRHETFSPREKQSVRGVADLGRFEVSGSEVQVEQ
jgi:hypothetical protein